MTKTKQARLRRRYNAMRRVNRGWTPPSWETLNLMAARALLGCTGSIGVREFLRAYYGIR